VLQLARVFADSLARLADACVRTFHLQTAVVDDIFDQHGPDG
jgi:hypothetical protein